MNKSKSPNAPPPRWLSILLPLVAGLLHLHVFYHATASVLRAVLPSGGPPTSAEFRSAIYLADRAVFLAYAFDLACCLLGVIPFSRCGRPSDIVRHHAPTLLLALPLAVPLWSGDRRLEPTASAVLALGADSAPRADFAGAYAAAGGFAYMSSLNEVFMCFQRLEMTLRGASGFRDLPPAGRRWFTGRLAVGAELHYKLLFFWGISVLACGACCDFDRRMYHAIAVPGSYDGSVWAALGTVYSSPAVLRGVLFRAFSVVMYPSMGRRCLNKIKQFHDEGRDAKAD